MMRIKNHKDFWSGIMFMAVGAGFAWGATNYSFGNKLLPGPGYFPFGLGILTVILGAIVLLKSLARGNPETGRVERVVWKPLLLVIGSVVLFGFTLPYLGLFIALPLLVFTSALAGDEFRIKEVLLNALILTVGCWAVFVLGLSLVIPLWPKFLG